MCQVLLPTKDFPDHLRYRSHSISASHVPMSIETRVRSFSIADDRDAKKLSQRMRNTLINSPQCEGQVCEKEDIEHNIQDISQDNTTLQDMKEQNVFTPLDMEEIVSENQINESLSASIVVDYEDNDVTVNLSKATVDCAPRACQPLELEMSSSISSRRRSRKISRDNELDMIEQSERHVKLTESTQISVNLPVETRCSPIPKLCLCEVKQHKTADSCWIVVKDQVYDVTGILNVHPGRPRSILNKAGGQDCYQDMQFHTRKARKWMEKCAIGKLERCGDTNLSTQGEIGCILM